VIITDTERISDIARVIDPGYSDHKAQVLQLTVSKHKNKRTVRLIVSETVRYFHEQLLQESWEEVFSTNDVNSSFNKF
jgi:hypothetical protein